MRTIPVVCLLLALAACASAGGLPYPRWAEVGRQWGCEPLAVQAANVAAHEGKPRYWQPTPEVGWTACELMAQVGEPRRVDHVQTQTARADNLFYRDPVSAPGDPEMHLVTLAPDSAGVWRVDTVVW